MDNEKVKRIKDVIFWLNLTASGLHGMNAIVEEIIKLATMF